jgi:hypothetical protein
MSKHQIIQSLQKLCSFESIPVDSIGELLFEFKPIQEYIESLKLKSKPETAANELLRAILNNIIDAKVVKEVGYGRDVIDYVIHESHSNPILIELKGLFRFSPPKKALLRLPFKYPSYMEQIQKYLRHRNVEYVVLTNLHSVYIFNREAILEFKPFEQTTLAELLEKYEGSLWDTIKRFEDKQVKPDLDIEFFESLKHWFAHFNHVEFKSDLPYSKEELVILFFNKFIFIKTLEDYSAIPYRFIQDHYKEFVRLYENKGFINVFQKFFREIHEFFEMNYDTELFKSNFFEFIQPQDENIETFRLVFEQILGLDEWSITFGKGLIHYNYRQINEDVFGKAYESWIAENRKDEGIYYTPASITEYMTRKLVNTLFDPYIEQLKAELKKGEPDADVIDNLMISIQNIRIIDPTAGSGSFLIKVLKAVYEKYQTLEHLTRWVNNVRNDDNLDIPDNIRLIDNFRVRYFFAKGDELKLISSVILHHIFAADKDERALDTAKTNLWKEAVKLNPRIYEYRELKRDKFHILPNLELNFICGDSLCDIDFKKQIEIIISQFKPDIVRLHQIRNEYLKKPYHPEIIEEALEIKKKIRVKLKQELQLIDKPLFFCLEYFYCFFDENGSPLSESDRGFSGIISNPPWEAIKPVKKEFAKQGKYEMDILHFKKWFDDKLKTDEAFCQRWQDYTDFYEKYATFLYGKYQYQSTGDPNYYKFFMERDFQIIRNNGLYSLLVPSGFQTDKGSNRLRELLIESYRLIELSSFENRGYGNDSISNKMKLFPEVDNRFKFSIVFAQKTKSEDVYSFNAKFYLNDPKDLKTDSFITYDIEKIRQFSPENLSIMEFRTDRDYELCKSIRKYHKLFNEIGIRIRSEFHMTNDSKLFNDLKKHKKDFCKLYEGKMIHQFHSAFSAPRYFVKESDARKELLKKAIHRIRKEHQLSNQEFKKIEIPDNLLLDYQTYRLVWRDVGNSTNERTLICSIVPPSVFLGNTLNYIVNINYASDNDKITTNILNYIELLFIMPLFNSLVLNFYVRSKITAHLNLFSINELPIAEAADSDRQRIVELGFNLLYRKSNRDDFEDLKNDLKIEIDESRDLAEMRAELEIIIAKDLYQLDKSDWEYLTSTFTSGGASDTKAELDRIIALSKEMWQDSEP